MRYYWRIWREKVSPCQFFFRVCTVSCAAWGFMWLISSPPPAFRSLACPVLMIGFAVAVLELCILEPLTALHLLIHTMRRFTASRTDAIEALFLYQFGKNPAFSMWSRNDFLRSLALARSAIDRQNNE